MVLWEFFHARFYLVVGKPAALSFRTGSPPETGESASELSPSGSDEDEPWRWDRFCRQAASTPEPDRDARLRARRKLCIACGVSLVFMAGEMMGEQKSNLVIPQPFPEGGGETCFLTWRLACRWIRRSQSGHRDGRAASSDRLRQHRHQPLLPVAVLPASHRRHDLRVAPSR